jgi:hypothetical protein
MNACVLIASCVIACTLLSPRSTPPLFTVPRATDGVAKRDKKNSAASDKSSIGLLHADDDGKPGAGDGAPLKPLPPARGADTVPVLAPPKPGAAASAGGAAHDASHDDEFDPRKTA